MDLGDCRCSWCDDADGDSFACGIGSAVLFCGKIRRCVLCGTCILSVYSFVRRHCLFERLLVLCVFKRVTPCGRNLLALLATSLCICCVTVEMMEEETLLDRFHRECPFTYDLLSANVDFL